MTPATQGTRFHIVTRITISDRSRWIPVGEHRCDKRLSFTNAQFIDQRSAAAPDHTHRWWLCIGAPTYVRPCFPCRLVRGAELRQ
jgi:hypothetical protein